jgi:hypothetical protein
MRWCRKTHVSENSCVEKLMCRIILVPLYQTYQVYSLVRPDRKPHHWLNGYSVLSSSVVDRVFEPHSGKTNDNKIGIRCFSVKYTTIRNKSSDWMSRNQDNMSNQWSNVSTRRLLFQWASTIKIRQRGHHQHCTSSTLYIINIVHHQHCTSSTLYIINIVHHQHCTSSALIIILSKCNLFSPWCNWKLNNNHSLTRPDREYNLRSTTFKTNTVTIISSMRFSILSRRFSWYIIANCICILRLNSSVFNIIFVIQKNYNLYTKVFYFEKEDINKLTWNCIYLR